MVRPGLVGQTQQALIALVVGLISIGPSLGHALEKRDWSFAHQPRVTKILKIAAAEAMIDIEIDSAIQQRLDLEMLNSTALDVIEAVVQVCRLSVTIVPPRERGLKGADRPLYRVNLRRSRGQGRR